MNLIRDISNIPGWMTNRHIVTIESDDWCSIRMPSQEVFNSLVSKGVDLTSGDNLRFNTYDSIESSEDLSALFEVLYSIRDFNGYPTVFTPVCVTGNPDFKKIKANDYNTYFFESITETYKRVKDCDNIMPVWKQGLQDGIFIPQFHGREHLNVIIWLKALKNDDRDTKLAFEYGLWGFNNKNKYNISYQAAFQVNDPSEIIYHGQVIRDGLKEFESMHGYKAILFVPPNGPINNILENVSFNCGIKFITAAKIQYESVGYGKTKKSFHWLGQKSKIGLYYLTRNCFFEPSDTSKDWVDSCLKEIQSAFRWKKPAIISSHRVNYIGRLHKINRDNGLRSLEKLLKQIIAKWPDVEFIDSGRLGNIISGNEK